MQIKPLGLPIQFVPAKIEPLEPLEDGIERGLSVALDVGVVDAQHQGAAVVARVQPVKDEGACTADVQIPRGRGGEANSKH